MLSSVPVRRPLRFLAAALVAGVTSVTLAHAALVSIGDSDVGFQAVGPGGLKIDGEGSKITASEADGELTLVAPLNNLKTGISMRDDHLKKAIHTDKHPTATLKVKRTALKFPEDQKTFEGKAKGDFTLNGTTKPVDFDYKVTRQGSDYLVQGRSQIDITQFNLEIPCYLGVCVDKTVKIKAKFKLRDKM